MSQPGRATGSAANMPIGAENGRFSAVTNTRTIPANNVLPWPVSLAKSEVSLFLHGEQLKLFPEDDEIDVAALRKKEAQRAASSHAEGTQRAYDSSWRDFQTFCQRSGKTALPSPPSTVTLYLTFESTLGLAAGTITRRLVAIGEQHKRAGYPNPCADLEVRDCLKRIRRELGTASHPKLPIWPDDLKLMLEASGTGVRAIRDRALMLLLFASGMRRSELVALNVDDVTSEPAGLRISILRSKTDPDGKGQQVGANRGQHKATCPVRALEAWTAVRGRQPGPLFCQVLKSGKVTGKRLAGRAVARITKQAAKSVGLDPAERSGHSWRRGCASSAVANGADILAVQKKLRHKSLATTAKYVDDANVFSKNLFKGVL